MKKHTCTCVHICRSTFGGGSSERNVNGCFQSALQNISKTKSKIQNYEVIFFHFTPKSANLVFDNNQKQADSHKEKVLTKRLHHIKTMCCTQVSSKVLQV